MAEKKKEDKKTEFAGEGRLSELLGKVDKEFAREMEGRPYLLCVASGYMLGREGDSATLAAQWSWRSNVIVGGEDSGKVASFLADQLKEVADHPEHGVRRKYKK